MNNKESILLQVKDWAKEGLVSRNELIQAYDDGLQKNEIQHPKIANLLYYIGGTIVFIGIIIMVGQNWISLSDFTKIFITLGSAFAFFTMAVLFAEYKQLKRISDAFYFLSALLSPLGLVVTFDIFKFDVNTAGMHSLMTAMLFVMYGVTYILNRRTVALVFTIIFGTWLYLAFTTFFIGGRPFRMGADFICYRWLISSVSYILLGYVFSQSRHQGLTGWLYTSGVFAFLGSALTLGKWHPGQNVFWEVAFPGLAFGVLFLSIHLRSKAFLIWGALYLMAYIIKITMEYFQRGLGWPVALIIAGFSLMAVGYLAFYLNNKYMTSSH